MVYPAHVVHTLIASPSDVGAERAALRNAIWEFNDEHTPSNQVVLLPRVWERNSTPRLGADPQDILDEQIVDSSDIAIGIFWTRIGQILSDGTPATVHELERFVMAGKPALLYFSNQPAVPASIDQEQFAAVQEFKERAKKWGVYREYSEVAEFVEHARRDLLATVRDRLRLPQVTAPGTPATAARPVARVDKRQHSKTDSKGKLKVQDRSYLVVDNKGAGDCSDLRIEWMPPEGAGDDDPPFAHGIEDPIQFLVAGASVEFQLMLSFGSSNNGTLRISWHDDEGERKTSLQTVVF